MRKKGEQAKSVDIRDSVTVVTRNDFITAVGIEKMSLKARKLLYIAISQCRKTDKDFYEYSITIGEFANLMAIDVSNLYKEARVISDELMGTKLHVMEAGEREFTIYNLFSMCKYTADFDIRFKLNPDMTRFLLQLKGNFSKPLLHDFLRMRSPYSMAVWHLMQREMRSRKPGVADTVEFDLPLEELREVTGTTSKFRQISEFKARVLDKALREISENTGVEVTYENIKRGRRITGFHFSAVNAYLHVDIPPDKKRQIEERVRKRKAAMREARQ